MALTTAGDLITFALKTAGVLGVGQTASAEDANDGLVLLSAMFAQWQRQRWLIWSLVDTALTSTGATTYTVGLTGDFAIARPDKIDSAFVRLLSSNPTPIDWPLVIIEAREDYNLIAAKTLQSVPVALFYDSAYPTGILRIWPVPPASIYEIHITTKVKLPALTALTDLLTVPPEYTEALIYSLAVRLCMNYGIEPRPSLVGAMKVAMNTLRLANTQIESLLIPGELLGPRCYSDYSKFVGTGLGSAFVLGQGTVL
jgi:hypothetical protein